MTFSLNALLRCLVLAMIVSLVGLGISNRTSAQSDDGFYRGKTVNLYIGYPAGQTYDIYARLAAKHLPRFIPGSPNVVASNMHGVGSLKVTNYMFQQAAQDGTALAMAGQSIAFEQMVSNPAVSFDARKFNWIGRLVPVVQFIVASQASSVRSLEQVTKREVVMAGMSRKSVTGTVPRLLNRYADTKFKMVFGYHGLTDALLAMQRGEAESATATAQQVLSGDQSMSLLVQYSKGRNRMFPNVPAMGEFGTTEQGKMILQLYGSTAELGRSLFASPNVPDARVQILRAAFEAMVRDPVFIAEAAKAKLELDPLSGAEIGKLVDDTINIPGDIARQAREAVQ